MILKDMEIPDIDIDAIADPNLQKQVRKQQEIIEFLVENILKLQTQVQELQAEVSRLKKQPKRPQFSSSSISVTKVLQSQAKKSGWHKCVKMNSLPIHTKIVVPPATCCSICGGSHLVQARSRVKIVQDIRIESENTKYTGFDMKCKTCGTAMKAAFPKEIQGLQFGNRLRSLVSVAKFGYRMSEGMIARFLGECGVSISAGQIDFLLQQNQQKLTVPYTHLKTFGVAGSSHMNTDATGHKHQVRRTSPFLHQHLQYLGTEILSIFAITTRYTRDTFTTMLGKRHQKKDMVSDDGSAYKGRTHQLCWIHELRHYQKLRPVVPENRRVLTQVKTELHAWYARAKTYGADPTPEQQTYLRTEYQRICTQKTPYRELNNRLKLTLKKENKLLLFLTKPHLPIQNNQAERDLREAVKIRDISYGTRSNWGKKSFAKHLSVIQTIRKKRLPLLQTMQGLLTGSIHPSILTS
jgi:hypothetical protein